LMLPSITGIQKRPTTQASPVRRLSAQKHRN
jgi:hypothetical protein